MTDPVVCQMFLEKLLDVQIREVKLVDSQHAIENQYSAKGIRLDIYVADDDGTVYAVEMQRINRDIEKRSRFYQSSMDMDLLQKGKSYAALSTSFVIFICTFDPFAQGRHLYSFQNRCDQDTALKLQDKAYWLFLSTKGTSVDVDPEIKEFLAYLEQSTEQVAKGCEGDLVKAVHKRVEAIRSSEECEMEFMMFMQKMKDLEEEAKEKGWEEGWEKGLEQGMEKGMEKGMQQGMEQGMERGLEKGLEQGMEKGKIEMIENMLKTGLPLETVIQISGFNTEQIAEIQKRIQI